MPKTDEKLKKSNRFRVYHEIKIGKEVFTTEINLLTGLNIFRMINENDDTFLPG